MTLDQYGGIVERSVPENAIIAGTSGRFATAKLGDALVFRTPDGHAYWLNAVFATGRGGSVMPTDATRTATTTHLEIVRKKFATPADPSGAKAYGHIQVERLKRWGFNALGNYADQYASPIPDAIGNGGKTDIPMCGLTRPAYYAMQALFQSKPQVNPIKNLIAGTNSAIVDASTRRRLWIDVFDPYFVTYVQGWLAPYTAAQQAKIHWSLGTAVADNDELFGSGPGPDYPAARIHPDPSYFALTTSPVQLDNAALKITAYPDTKVYTKHATVDWLRAKYGNAIAALNAAWGSSYTTFGSDGGWSTGRGLLDESGHNPWVGTDYSRLTTCTPGVRADLGEILFMMYDKLYGIIATRLRERDPSVLVWSQVPVNTWGGLSRKPQLRAIGKWVDVVNLGYLPEYNPDKPLVLWQESTTFANPPNDPALAPLILADTLAAIGTDKPFVLWSGVSANADTSLFDTAVGIEGDKARTQEERAVIFREARMRLVNQRSAAGVRFWAGTQFWAYLDSIGERRNWGLVSHYDNPYDSKANRVAPGVEVLTGLDGIAREYPTGGEWKDGGDFLTGVTAAHRDINLLLAGEPLPDPVPDPDPEPDPVPEPEPTPEPEPEPMPEEPSMKYRMTSDIDITEAGPATIQVRVLKSGNVVASAETVVTVPMQPVTPPVVSPPVVTAI